MFFFAYKKLAQFAVRGALPPRRSESPVCATDNKPSRVLHLLGWFIGSHGFSSLERRPEFWVLHYVLGSELILLKWSYYPKQTTDLMAIAIKIPMKFFTELEQKTLIYITKLQTDKLILRKQSKVGGIMLSDIRLYCNEQ